jgi:serine/threonine-protein kinase
MILQFAGKNLLLDQPITMGRHRDNTIKLNDSLASRQHARVAVLGSEAWIIDLDSANGTRVNGVKVEGRRLLTDGDTISIGKCDVVYRLANDDGSIPSAPPAAAPATDPTTPAGSSATPVPATPSASMATTRRIDDLIGILLAGYRINRLLSQDAFSALFVAHQVVLKRAVALRVFRPEVLAKRPEIADQALMAARQAGRLEHCHLVQMHECGITDGFLWCSLELVDGRSLADIVSQNGPLDADPACSIIERTALALTCSHAGGVFHGDLGPHHLLLDGDGVLKVTDVGLASIQLALRTDAGAVIGSPLYCAPETVADGVLDAGSDIYSLGCTFHYLLTGEPPFTGPTPATIHEQHCHTPIPDPRIRRPELPVRINQLLQGMMAKNREWRYQNAGELLAEVRSVRAEINPAPVAAAAAAVAPTPRPRSGRLAPRPATGSRPNAAGNHSSRGLITLIVIAIVLIGVLVAMPSIRRAWRTDATPPAPMTPPVPAAPGEDPDWARHGRRFDFIDPIELSAWTVTTGEPRLSGGRLSGPADEPVIMRCDHPFGGPNWSVSVRVALTVGTGGNAQFSLHVADHQRNLVQLSLANDSLTATVRGTTGTDEVRRTILTTAELADLPITIRCRRGAAEVSVAGRILVPPAPIPPLPSGLVGFEGNAIGWAMDELTIVGRVPPPRNHDR